MISRIIGLISAIVISLSFAADAAGQITIPGLSNTGVDDSGNILPIGSVDSHYELDGPSADTAFVIPTQRSWYVPDSTAAWIGIENGDMNAPEDTFRYYLTFDLTGDLVDNLTISGNVAADNEVRIFINDSLMHSSQLFTELTPFIIDRYFTDTTENVIEFEVVNINANPLANPSGLLVTNLEASLISGVSNETALSVGSDHLYQNFPNPFLGSTNIKFVLSKAEHISLIVYDLLGREVATLANGFYSPGTHEVSWEATGFPNGVYIYRLDSRTMSSARQMVFVQ